MINFSETHPFQNAVGKLLLFNRGKRDTSKWKLDDDMSEDEVFAILEQHLKDDITGYGFAWLPL